MRLQPVKVLRKAPRKGLGDRVEAALAPIVSRVDKLLGTDIASCSGCKKRKTLLNKIHL